MKYIITEGQIENVFDVFIERYKPELLSLDAEPIYAEELGKVYGYEFTNDIYLYFTYRSNPESNSAPNDNEFPTLRLSSKLYRKLESVFGKFSEKLIKDWFEQHYGLPVKTVKNKG